MANNIVVENDALVGSGMDTSFFYGEIVYNDFWMNQGDDLYNAGGGGATIADNLAINLVDRVFEAPEVYSSLEVLLALYAYTIQIYLDFSAYSDIAVGIGKLMGVRTPENFDRPYLARNMIDFWGRWHISLSHWLTAG